MTYWAEYGRTDAISWLRSSRKPGLHPVTRRYFIGQAMRCHALYKRDVAL
jgi:hypothetical protein